MFFLRPGVVLEELDFESHFKVALLKAPRNDCSVIVGGVVEEDRK